MKQVPAPPWNIVETIKRAVFAPNPFRILEDAKDLSGDIYQLNFGLWTGYVIGDPTVIEEISKNLNWNIINKNPVTEESKNPVQQAAGDFNLITDGYFHKHFRDIMNKQLTKTRLQGYVDILTNNFDATSCKWPINKAIDIAHDITQIFVDVIFRGMMDVTFSKEENEYMRKTLEKAAEVQKQWMIYGNIASSRFAPNAIKYRKMVVKTRKILEHHYEKTSQCPMSIGYIKDFMTKEINTRNACIDVGRKKVIDDMFGVLVAGVETVASTLIWSLRILMERPEIVNNIRKEAHAVIENYGELRLNYEKLNYARTVFLETLRLYPVFPVITKLTLDEMVVNDYVVPAKSWILIPCYTMHRDSRWYESPEEFIPERWKDNTWALKGGFEFIAFGLGTHRCSGWELALIEGSLFLSMLFSKYQVNSEQIRNTKSIAHIPYKYSLNLSLKEQLRLYISPLINE